MINKFNFDNNKIPMHKRGIFTIITITIYYIETINLVKLLCERIEHLYQKISLLITSLK